MNAVIYNNRKFRIISAFVASFCVVIYGTRFDVLRALTSPIFYLVLAISFAVAFLLVQFVHYITKRLDAHYDWRTQFVERMVFQILLGVVVPMVIDMILYSIYFAVLGQNIFENGFFHIDLPFVGMLLLLLNFYYCIYYFVLTDRHALQREMKKEWASSEQTSAEKGRQLLTAICSGLDGTTDLKTDVLYFYSTNKQVYLVLHSGKELPVNSSLRALSEVLAEFNFTQINRSIILNFRTVLHFKTGTKRDTLTLLFKEKYHFLPSNHGNDYFVVTKHYIRSVLKVFD